MSSVQRPRGRHRAMSPRRKVRLRRTLLVTGALLAVAVLAGVMIPAMRLQGSLETAPLRAGTDEADPLPTDGMNILVLGSDSRDLTSGNFEQGDGSKRSDSLMVVHLAEDDDRIDVVQIPRDTVLELPACADAGRGEAPSRRGMINSALNYGPACSVRAAEELTGVGIDHFVEVDFDGFADIIDALGGIPVHLEETLQDPFADLDLPQGDQVLDGYQALAWARTRHAVGDGSDIARLDHQKEVIDAIANTVRHDGVLNRPDRLYSFLDAVIASLTVDDDLGSVRALATLATRVSHVDQDDITIVTMPWEPAPGDPNRVVPSADAEDVFTSLTEDVPLPAQA
ncbi:LCP family protein [Brachybacterium sp. GCM10030267]|uniref:LCP family protein n=1 Tax=unclassified Brachybacterium TaxID=2623841 RepID=UPI0036161DFC